MHKTGAACVAPAVVLSLAACEPNSLRGSIEPSEDGGTYLVIAADNGGICDAIKVDGKVWPLALERAGPVSPGPHVVECSAENAAAGIPIVIPEGMVFTFEDWYPDP
jgi:hypothetical protein